MANLESRRILLVSTTGGFTHAAPVLEIGAVLNARGHEIQFATCTGQESWTADYPFITKTHIIGPGPSDAETNVHYDRMRLWRPEHGMGPMMESKRLYDSYWTDTYHKFRELCEDPATRPDFMVVDFFVDAAARDMLKQFNVQFAALWPQMPPLMAPASYIPGQPGFQVDDSLTSEHASMASRFRNEMFILHSLRPLLSWVLWTKRMRTDAGVTYSLPPVPKPDYLVLVNSFFGLEVPKDLPPLMVPVGPILGDEYPPLDDDMLSFLEQHDKTIYVSLGTHICLPTPRLESLLLGFIEALDAGHINGVIWSISARPRANFHLSKTFTRRDGSIIATTDLLSDSHPQFRLPTFAPQRAILAHANTKIFLTHGGGSSANETLFHGTPTLSIGYFFDQLCNSVRLKDAGVGRSLDKDAFTPTSIAESIGEIVTDADGSIARNVLRMRRISMVASRKKHYAADLIEEVMYDQELRFKDGVEKRPMHLQTADMRMPLWKARNWDMWFVGLTGLVAGGVAGWWVVREGLKRMPRIIGHASVLASTFVGVLAEKRLRGWR
ncbi:Fc.00g017020.m01.CDS01 [Cosmosporella sp. VM-42]